MLTVKKLAEELSMAQRTVYQMISDGRINAVKIGTSVRIPEEEFERIQREGVK